MAFNVSQFIEQVRCRPAIWMTDSKSHKDTKRVASAWQQLCQLTWPEFDSWPKEKKRYKCLVLQRKWKSLKEGFIADTNRQKKLGEHSTPKSKHHELLTFLTHGIDTDRGKPEHVAEEEVGGSDKCREPPAKKTRVHRSLPSDSVERLTHEEPDTSLGMSVSRDSTQDNEEDRHFLLSLLSHMSDVPRVSKLALREDMIKLIRKYTSPSPPPSDVTKSSPTASTNSTLLG